MRFQSGDHRRCVGAFHTNAECAVFPAQLQKQAPDIIVQASEVKIFDHTDDGEFIVIFGFGIDGFGAGSVQFLAERIGQAKFACSGFVDYNGCAVGHSCGVETAPLCDLHTQRPYVIGIHPPALHHFIVGAASAPRRQYGIFPVTVGQRQVRRNRGAFHLRIFQQFFLECREVIAQGTRIVENDYLAFIETKFFFLNKTQLTVNQQGAQDQCRGNSKLKHHQPIAQRYTLVA